jgi:hypothetical protein
MRGNYQKVTPIDQLPELYQVEPIQQSVAQPEYAASQGEVNPKLHRFIRPQSHGMPVPPPPIEYYEQEMGNFQPVDEAYSGISRSSFDLTRNYKPKHVPINVSPPVMANNSNMEPYEPADHSHSHYNCKDLYGHVKECDICKRFYRTDNTVYLIIIAILLIACTLLAKKVMNI